MDGGEHDVDRYTIIEIGDATRIIVDEGSPSPHIKVTLYRLLNTALVSAFGLSKAILVYKGESIAPTTLELIMGVIVGNLLWWLGYGENINPPVWPWFFHNDYSLPALQVLLNGCRATYILIVRPFHGRFRFPSRDMQCSQDKSGSEMIVMASGVDSRARGNFPSSLFTSRGDNTENETAASQYARMLLPHGFGYPLWFPGVHQSHPELYRTRGIGIGDVGFISKAGSFEFCFNVFENADHPLNYKGVPLGFQPIPREEVSTSHIEKGTEIFVSKPVSTLSHLHDLPTNHPDYESVRLTLPDGALRRSQVSLGEIRRHTLKNLPSWLEFIRHFPGGGLPLFLVTGCDLASSWSIDVTYDSRTIRRSTADIGTQNQCIFLRGFKIVVQDSAWKRIRRRG